MDIEILQETTEAGNLTTYFCPGSPSRIMFSAQVEAIAGRDVHPLCIRRGFLRPRSDNTPARRSDLVEHDGPGHIEVSFVTL